MPGWIAEAFEGACLTELDALKPGNVHRFAGGHGMEVAAFEASASVSAPRLAEPGASVGSRILGAVRATREAVGVNTNLGILLLSAPLAAAAERAEASGRALRNELGAVLARLSAKDAADVFQAIALASPGGLGRSDEADVADPPTVGLLQAMRIAAPRDRIARAYTDVFGDVFGLGLAAIADARETGVGEAEGALAAYLAFATAFPDSHIARKYGAARAQDVRGRFIDLANQLNTIGNLEAREAMLLAFDRDLKAEGLNPGTSADLTVASIFTERLQRRLEDCRGG